MYAVVLCMVLCVSYTESAKILGVFHPVAHSHFTIGFRLMKELADRGHEVTLVSPFLQKNPIKNLREIQLTGFIEEAERISKGRNLFDVGKLPAIASIALLGTFGEMFLNMTLGNENVQKLLHSNETFDLVIVEQFLSDGLQGFAYHFKAPCVLVSTVGSSIWTNRQVGNPAPPSYIPQMLLSYSSKMNFFQRVYNVIVTIVHELYDHLYFLPKQNAILHKYLPDAPHLNDLIYNTSLILLNSHVSINQPVPHVPNMIEIGGFHVQEPKKLPEDLQKILDNSPDGVIFFSMGSNLKSKDLPQEKLDMILKTLSQLKSKVLWKWEDDNLPGRPSNVIIRKWFPQSDVLAHPNVKLFITHGGHLSTTEAIYFGVPVVGIPVFGDQHINMVQTENNGNGISIPYTELSEQKLTSAIREVLENPKYSQIAKERSIIMHDQPVKPIDIAIYWVEYVIRHKGAPHLQTAAVSLKWYQYMLFDVIAFLALVAFVSFILFYMLIRKLLGRSKNRKQKIN